MAEPNKREQTLYAVPFPIQKAEIGELCWGDGCGKGGIGALHVGNGLTGVPCAEQTCPYSERESDPIGEIGGQFVRLRKLRNTPPKPEGER